MTDTKSSSNSSLSIVRAQIADDLIEVVFKTCSMQQSSGISIACSTKDSVASVMKKYVKESGIVHDLRIDNCIMRDSLGTRIRVNSSMEAAGMKDGDILVIYPKSKMKVKRCVNIPNVWCFFSLLCVLTISIVLSGVAILKWMDLEPFNRYLIVMDAGSVHTSVSTYRFPVAGKIKEVSYCEVGETGVSSFIADPLGAAKFISSSECLLSSISKIPSDSKNVSKILLGSTAGMRVLRLKDPEVTQQIIGNLSAELKRVSGSLTSEIRILDGIEEGINGWVTVNYLKEFKSNGDIGALDWGGASSQITRSSPNSSGIFGQNKKVTVGGISYQLFSKSNLCYGQFEALKRHKALLAYKLLKNNSSDSHGLTVNVEDPCLPKDAKVEPVPVEKLLYSPCSTMKNEFLKSLLVNEIKTIRFVPNQNMSLCSQFIEHQFNLESCKSLFTEYPGEETCLNSELIPPPGGSIFMAFSTYWYLMSRLNMSSRINYEEFEAKISEICSSSSEKLISIQPYANSACFVSLFMTQLLMKGYHFNASTWSQIRFVKRISGAEVGWTLGEAIIDESSSSSTVEKSRQVYLSFPVLALLFSCCGLLGMLSLGLVVQSFRIRREEKEDII